MDMMMVDISSIDCHEGDEVIISLENTQEQIILPKKTIPLSYELITAISQRVKRVFYRDN